MESAEFWQAAWNTWHCTLLVIMMGSCGVYMFVRSNAIGAMAAAVVVLVSIGLSVIDIGYGATNSQTFHFVWGFVWIAVVVMYTFGFIRRMRRAFNEGQEGESSCGPGGR